jgi:hypothetical protein
MSQHAESSKCGAKNRAGLPCGRPAGWGTPHPGIGRCKLHGGSSPNANRAAERELQRREVERAVTEWGLEVDTSPTEAMLAQVRKAAGRVAAIEWRMRHSAAGDGLVVDAEELTHDDAGEGPALLVRESLARQWGTDVRVVENPLLGIHRQSVRDLVEFSAACRRAGIEEAMVAATIAEAERYLGFLEGVARRLGVDFDDRWIEAGAGAFHELDAAEPSP